MRILVTGGAGYIGSVVTSLLVAENHDVVVLDNLSRGHRDTVPAGVPLREVDLLDAKGVGSVVSEGFDAVLHFAALSLVGESMQEPVRYFRTDVGGTLNLLDAMRTAGVKQLVASSTAAVYGAPSTTPITEETPTIPTNPYGASKLAMDHVIGYEAAASGLGAASLRYFNVAGASGHLGERHEPETHLIPLVLAVAAGLRPRVQVMGTDYPTPDGTAVRDYIHVDDLARAHLLALRATARLAEGSGGHRIFNLGNGAGYSVRQVIDVARHVTGAPIATEEVARRPGDPPILVASSDRIASELGWAPRKPDLATTVSDAWDFHRRRIL